jgi:hypothetical protein
MQPNWAQKNPALADAAKHFPKLVFREWLKLRRQGADQFFPKWRDMTCKRRRIQILDLGAVLKARFN